ncbi:MAG: RNA polymerase sigma factor [Anaerolineae bacterium]
MARFFRGEPFDEEPCAELFRRALFERDQVAWEEIYRRCEPMVEKWVQAHRCFPDTGEESAVLVNGAFSRFWQAISRCGKFQSLSQMLKYLKMCVHSEITDILRRKAAPSMISLNDLPELEGGEPSPAQKAMGRIVAEKLEKLVLAQAKTEKERLIVDLVFFRGLKPRQIYSRYDNSFESVEEVYKIKRKVLGRLLRNREIRRLREE